MRGEFAPLGLETILELRALMIERGTIGLFACNPLSSDQAKGAWRRGWKTEVLTPEELGASLGHGDLIGVRPDSPGLLVVDVDRGDSAALIEAHPPLARGQTPSGDSHLLYPERQNLRGTVGGSARAAQVTW